MSVVASDDAVNRVEHLVKYLSYRVFGQAMYRHVIYIVVFMNSISSSFIALSTLIPYPYLLAITAHSFSVGAIVVGVVGIRVGIRVGTRVVVV